MFLEILKKCSRLFVFYYFYTLVLFLLIIAAGLYILNFSDYRFVGYDQNLIDQTYNSIVDLYYDFSAKKDYSNLEKYLESYFNKDYLTYKLNKEEKTYQLCINLNTNYNFRRFYNLTLDLYQNYRNFYDDPVFKTITYQSTNKIDNFFYHECYIVKIS